MENIEIENKKIEPVFSLSLPEIASWQVPNIECEGVKAALPALQRGAVWKPNQTERLWDSILRGFPVGAFLMSNFDEQHYGQASMKLGICSSPKYHLLDGQQRATAIALGFYNLWETDELLRQRHDGPVLWLDFSAPPSGDDRDFIFRVLTRSHPWGYRRNLPDKRLENKAMHNSIQSFRACSPQFNDKKSSVIPLSHVWPWEAEAPLPMPLLIKAIQQGGDVIAQLKKELAKLPFWGNDNAHLSNGKRLQQVIESMLNGEDQYLNARFEQVVAALRPMCDAAHKLLPVQILPENKQIETAHENRADPVETLFVRVNSGGTKLEGEELIYSLLKSAWPDAPGELAKLQPDGRQWITPARMALLTTRLLLVHEEDNNEHKAHRTNPPPIPDLARFRKLMHEPGRLARMKTFISTNVVAALKDACDLMMQDLHAQDATDFRLPPTLAANFSSGVTGGELMLLLMRWTLRLNSSGIKISALSTQQRKCTLGFLTAVSWFAPDGVSCVQRMWPLLQNLPANQLPNFFNQNLYQEILTVDHKHGLIMLPLVSPTALEELIRLRVTSGSSGNPGLKRPECWESQKIWQHYTSRLAPDEYGEAGFKSLPQHMKSWLNDLRFESQNTDSTDPADISRETRAELKEDGYELRRSAWRNLLDKLWYERRLIDYAQRQWLIQWFPHFDPTQPGQMEDINRPWDYDHIHAANYISGKWYIPGIIRDWHCSIGNLRAWPLELNRADQDDSPAKKLNFPDESTALYHILNSYEIPDERALCSASFIHENNGHNSEYEFWKSAVPDENPNGHLTDPNRPEHRAALINAITQRFCRLYRCWYESLSIDEVTGG